jgi:hypothetical protein
LCLWPLGVCRVEPFGTREGPPIDVNEPGVALIQRDGATQGGVILSAELCDVTGDGIPEIALSVVQEPEGRITLDIWIHDAVSGEPLFEVLQGGLVVGCSDFDGNGADDIVANDFTQSWILFSDLD